MITVYRNRELNRWSEAFKCLENGSNVDLAGYCLSDDFNKGDWFKLKAILFIFEVLDVDCVQILEFSF